MIAFYITCAIFVFLILGTILRMVSGVSIFRPAAVPGPGVPADPVHLVVGVRAAPADRKMEHFGVSRPVVGITVPTGYSFNLDGTAIYLTMASLFIGERSVTR